MNGSFDDLDVAQTSNTVPECGVSIDMLYHLEHGKGSVQVDKLLKVLDGWACRWFSSQKKIRVYRS